MVGAQMTQSVLEHCNHSMVLTSPFPHIMVEDALPSELYKVLSDEYPPSELMSKGKTTSNRACFYTAGQIRARGRVSEAWREFIEYHASAAFYADIFRVFGEHIYELYSKVKWSQLSIGVRGDKAEQDRAFHMDAMFGINTPVIGKATSVRGRHLDNPLKLYNGLLYFKHDDDTAAGGEFLIYRRTDGAWTVQSHVPYRQNVLVFFVNTPHAVHAVSSREAGPYPRRYVSFCGEVKAPLFVAPKVL